MDPFGTLMQFLLMWWYTTDKAACGSNAKQGGQSCSSTSGSSCMPSLQRNDRKRGSTSMNARILCSSKHSDVFWTGMASMTPTKSSFLRSLLTLCPSAAAVSSDSPCRYTPKAKTDIETYGAGLFVPSTPSPVDAGFSRTFGRSSSSGSNKQQQAVRKVVPRLPDLVGPSTPGFMRATLSSKARSLGKPNRSSTHTLSSVSAAAQVDRVRKVTLSSMCQEDNKSSSKAQQQDIITKLRAKLKQQQELHKEAKASKAQFAAYEAELAQKRGEMTALKALLAAKDRQATLLQAGKTEVEQKLLLQVEATKAALQAQAETRAALAASHELSQKLLAQQKTNRALEEAQAALTTSQYRIEDLLEQQKDDMDALAALQKEVEKEKTQTAFEMLRAEKYWGQIGDQHEEILGLTLKVVAREGEVRVLELKLAAAERTIDRQEVVMGEQMWEQHQQQYVPDGYEVFMDAVDRHWQGRVSMALENCMLDSGEILNTPAAALCIAAGLANSSKASLQRVYQGLSLGCHSDHVGGGDQQQQQLNQVWGELQKVL